LPHGRSRQTILQRRPCGILPITAIDVSFVGESEPVPAEHCGISARIEPLVDANQFLVDLERAVDIVDPELGTCVDESERQFSDHSLND
jgi:hypothetical protein